MAAIASKFGRFFSRADEHVEAAASSSASPDPRNRVRAFPNEDIFFYNKHIDNSSVIRQADPAAERASWKMIAGAAMAAVLLIGVLMPKGYGVLAGYKIQSLRAEQEQLLQEQSALELEEASLMSPERMQVLAKQQQFVDPAPERIVYLEGQSDAEFAAMAKPSNRR